MKQAKIVYHETPIFCGADENEYGKNIYVYLENITLHQCFIVLKRHYKECCVLNHSDWWQVVTSGKQEVCIYNAPYEPEMETATKTAEFIVKKHNERLKQIGLRNQLKLF